ncbi:MAG: Rrf2 family transcriptional regulator [Victivallaceae bacterium]|jgi:Rrf2 family protein|nr:Rrf2 family transcriptional regulator [Victivallaceae bacterium]NLK84205.1 Rrf2 family transcriptional regulator [Lentisphaerota bacterium]MDD3115896.1 Rrf2 family transcriptional regulator [Victivallaceae bacterium]MDD3704260.1 Rrf2 family transcriptional regulator [Victivallaceae bacterium]MDD4317019.1 Rrf2 family transcriptional regulator [Victivallaceae bacterium]
MKISTKGRYGLRIMLDLALHQGKSKRLIRDISKSQNIPQKYLGRLIISLREAGFVHSVRGVNGGLQLARLPESLTALDIVEAMEGPLSIVDCVTGADKCDNIGQCATREIWERVNSEIRKSLASVTLKDIMDIYLAKQSETGIFDYSI